MQSLLILARDSGAIIRATGAITRSTAPDHPLAAEYAAAAHRYVLASEALVGELEGIDGGVFGGVAKPAGATTATAAAAGAGAAAAQGEEEVDGGDGRDDVRLIRVRTRRRELVVVPGLSPAPLSYAMGWVGDG